MAAECGSLGAASETIGARRCASSRIHLKKCPRPPTSPRSLPPPLDARTRRSSRPGTQIEPWYRQLLDRADRVRPRSWKAWLFDLGELNGAVSRGRGPALRRHDLPDRRLRPRGGPPRLHPRHRAPAQADPERVAEPLPRLAPPPCLARGPLSRLRPLTGEPPGTLSRGQHRPGDRAGRAGPAIPESHRGDDGPLPRAGADPVADGSVPRRDRPARPVRRPGSLDRRPSPRRPRRDRRPLRPDDRPPPARSPARPASATSPTTPTGCASASTTACPRPTAFQDAIEKVVVPLARRIQDERREAGMGAGHASAPGTLPSTRSAGRRLKPFAEVEELAEGAEAIFRRRRPRPRRRSSPTSGPITSSTSPTARERPRAATRRRWRTTGSRSSS